MREENIKRQVEVLGSLIDVCQDEHHQPSGFSGWTKPRLCGGRNGSYHSHVLAQLYRKGLAERKEYVAVTRKVYYYRPSQAGKEFFEMSKHILDE